jgi:hypothetical protein
MEKFVRGLGSGCLLLLAAGSAAAESIPPACKALANDVTRIAAHAEVADKPDLKVTAGPDNCVFSNVSIHVGRIADWSIDRLAITSPEIRSGFGKRPPASLRIDATGIRFGVRIGDAHARYLSSVMQKPFDVRLHYDWDQDGGHLQVHEISLESPWLGHASLAMDLDMPPDPDAPGSIPHDGNPFIRDSSIRQIHFVLDNRAIVESMMMPLLVGLVPKEKDPAIEFPKIQAMVEKQVHRSPTSQADAASKDALVRFVRDFPHPSGHFEETISFDPPLRLDDLRSDKKERWMRGAHVQAVYQPLPQASVR